ncbi:MAG: glycosyltransferase family 39 protein [Candidatus Shapirobacteria bacterium]|nr:glycosyltransferase family 39 protein [Candidatus Shapirobacteria bacterium]
MKKYWWLILGMVFHLIFNLIFLSFNKMPPAWDQAAHLKNSVIWNRVMSGELDLTFKELVGQSWGYPPLMMFIGGLWSMVFGLGVFQITFLSTLFLILGMLGVYKLSKELNKSETGAVLAALLFSFFPIIFDISRNYLLDLPLTVFVVWAIWALIKARYLADFNKYTVLFVGLFIFSSLTKLNGFLYFGPMFVYVLYRAIKDREVKIVKNLIIAGLIFLVGVGWWYFINFGNIRDYLKIAGEGESVTDPMNLFKLTTWFYYLKLFYSQQATAATSLLFFGALIFWKKIMGDNKNRGFILVFLILSYLIFTVIKNKDTRFTMPLLPVVAVMMGLTLAKLGDFNKIVGKIVCFILGIFIMLSYLSNSFEWPIKKNYFLNFKLPLIGWVEIINVSENPVRSLKTKIWPQKQIVKDIDDGSRVMVIINKEEINGNNLGLFVELADKSITMELVPIRWESYVEMENYLNQMDYVLVPDNDYDLAPVYVINLEALIQSRDFILSQRDNWQLINTYTVYDGKKLFLMKRL